MGLLALHLRVEKEWEASLLLYNFNSQKELNRTETEQPPSFHPCQRGVFGTNPFMLIYSQKSITKPNDQLNTYLDTLGV